MCEKSGSRFPTVRMVKCRTQPGSRLMNGSLTPKSLI